MGVGREVCIWGCGRACRVHDAHRVPRDFALKIILLVDFFLSFTSLVLIKTDNLTISHLVWVFSVKMFYFYKILKLHLRKMVYRKKKGNRKKIKNEIKKKKTLPWVTD